MKKLIFLFAVVFSLPLFASAQDKGAIVIRGGKLLTVSHGVIENGVLVMQDGKITAVGAAGSVAVPKGARVIDAAGMTVYPGLIDSESRLGLVEIDQERSTVDTVENSDEIMPHMHVYDAFHAESETIPVTRANGVTNAVVTPASEDTLPGQDSLVQLDGKSADEMIIGRDIALPLNFTGSQRRREKFPSTRMGLIAQVRQAFLDAQDYEQKWKRYDAKVEAAKKNAEGKRDVPEAPKHDLKLEALLPYLHGERPVVVAANTASDVETAVHLAQDFKLKIVLNRVAHAQGILDEIAALKVPVIVGPIYAEPRDDERYDTVFKLPAELDKRDVKIVLASYDNGHQVRNLPYAAGYAVAFGLPYDAALKAITLNAAEVWGVADKLGSLDVGKWGNVVIANGDPLDVKTDVKHVFIAGREVSLENRQTRLRDQYSH